MASNGEKFKKLSINTLIFAGANIGSKIINFLLVPLYTNILTRAQYGTAELILNCTNIVIPLISLSISDALLRFGLDKKLDVNAVLKSTSIVLSVGSIVCFAFTPLYSLYPGIGSWALMFSILCVIQMLRSTLTLFTKTLERNKLFAIDSIIYTFTLALLNILFLVYLHFDVKGYLLSYIFAGIVSCLFIAFRVDIVGRLKIGKNDRVLLINMLKYSIPMIANALSWWVIHFSDRVMLEQMTSVDDVGLYSAAAKIPNIFSTIISVFTQAWTISSVLEYDEDRDESFYSGIFALYICVLGIGSSVFLLFVKPFMQVYVGESFTVSWVYVPLLILATVYGAISTFVGPLYGAAKKNVTATITTVIGGTVNIVCNYILIKQFQIMGAVIATLVAYIVMGIGRLYNTRTFFKFYINQRCMWLTLIAVTIQAIFITLDIWQIVISLLSITIILLANKGTANKVFKRIFNMHR